MRPLRRASNTRRPSGTGRPTAAPTSFASTSCSVRPHLNKFDPELELCCFRSLLSAASPYDDGSAEIQVFALHIKQQLHRSRYSGLNNGAHPSVSSIPMFAQTVMGPQGFLLSVSLVVAQAANPGSCGRPMSAWRWRCNSRCYRTISTRSALCQRAGLRSVQDILVMTDPTLLTTAELAALASFGESLPVTQTSKWRRTSRWRRRSCGKGCWTSRRSDLSCASSGAWPRSG